MLLASGRKKLQGWPEGHGERRREEIREFQREEAGTLAKSRMAEVERAQLGETRRAGMREVGATSRTGMRQVGELERTKLTETGAMERAKLTGVELTPEKQAELRRKAYEMVLKGYDPIMPQTHPVTGKEMTPQEVRANMYQEAEDLYNRFMSGEQPAAKTATGRGWSETEAGSKRFEIEGEKITRTAKTPPPMITTPPLAVSTQRKKPGEVAARLRGEYEKEQAPPSILDYFGGKWRGRKKSTDLGRYGETFGRSFGGR